jgi:mono/diheme cytochrome c family protein
MTGILSRSWLALSLFLLGSVKADEPKSPPAKVDFNRDIRPILSNTCFACHGPDEKERKAGLRLDTREGALEGESIVVGKPDESEIIKRILSADPGEVMPPAKTGRKLSTKEVQTLKEWIKQGANYSRHWAYQKPVAAPLPNVGQAWAKNPIDRFVFQKLSQEKLAPQAEADRYTLVRRVALDVTGLPPKLSEVEEFLKDTSANAYEKMVDRFLNKPSYGEHWARLWLDLARYADSAGYADDPPRTIWAYRDYVIRSFNQNKPFDQFTIEQLAGDLLSNPSEEQLIATAFHRNTLTNNEGGTSDEEFRNVAVVDRVNTTMAVWMGTSIACAQCHTHKYDPLTQTEYFQLFAIFNNTADADRGDESPILPILSDAQKQLKLKLEPEIAKLKAEIAKRIKPSLAQGEAGLWKLLLQRQADKQQLTKLENQLKPLTTVPIFRELDKNQRRVTKLQYRGNFQDLGPVVTEGIPKAFHPLNKSDSANRLSLAKWLVDANNPLTARVVVNRYWEALWGSGIVRTSEEFGSQGELPVMPELLDWLAVELQNQKWDLKALLKLLVTSAAYRQSSRVTPEAQERDPDNRFASRGPRYRLSAETIRDQALAASGLLSEKMYGPSVKPPQPNFGLSAAFGRTLDWQTSTGEDKYRRGLYTEWRRTNPYPSMSTFDAPSRESCTIRRLRSNTPLQALVTLNDPVYVEASQALARKMATSTGDIKQKLAHGFANVLSRPPTENELAKLVKLFESTRETYKKDPAKAAKMATEPIGPAPKDVNIADLAAFTVVGNVLLNLDELFMRR